MKEEIVILAGEPESVYSNGKDSADGFTKFIEEEWHGPPMIREPQYIAIRVKGQKHIAVINEVDIKKSELDKGVIRFVSSFPIFVNIPLRFGKNKLQGITYTTFRKLITHETTDDL